MENIIREYKEKLNQLINIGIALTAEKPIDNLLDKIVEEALNFTRADAGSLYLKEGDELKFEVSQNRTLAKRMGTGKARRGFLSFRLPICEQNIAGYVALTGKALSIEDVYDLPEGLPFTADHSFDLKNNYRTQSMLVVPLVDTTREIIGVLQIINSMDEDGNVIPFDPDYENLVLALASQAAVSITNQRLHEELKGANLDMIHRLSVAAEFKDQDTAVHLKRMSRYSEVVAKAMGLTNAESESILFTSPMHDIGKIGIHDAILLKKGKLTDEEREEMKKHTIYGAEILTGSKHKLIKQAETIALTHHERWDGKGYPQGLKGEAIPLEGRIVALADVFDALSSTRCYKAAFDINEVIDLIIKESGAHFDPEVVKAFLSEQEKIMEIFNNYKEQ